MMTLRTPLPAVFRAILPALLAGACQTEPSLPPIDFDERPSRSVQLFDYAGVVPDLEESTNRYLSRMRENYRIEGIILTLPSIGKFGTLEAFAAQVFSSWEIGRDVGGRGLLLLLVDDTKEVKLEVAYELEGVFTDLYAGYVEDRQLGPNFREGELGVGLVAVMEEMELRAQMEQGEVDPAQSIDRRDRELLSGGAGARRRLRQVPSPAPAGIADAPGGRGGETAGEAWEIMLSKWKGEKKHLDRDIYTTSTKLAMGDQDNPDRRTTSHLATWEALDYQVHERDGYAVISFGNVPGWEKAPWLFARTDAGWQFDIVNQRKYVVMGRAPKWHVERTDHPYVDLFSRFSFTMAKDMPLLDEDRYDVRRDGWIAGRIRELQKRFARNPDDFATALELGRWATITSMRPNKSLPPLERAKRLQPQNPLPYKYLAIRHVDAAFQYESALGEMEHYLGLVPDDPFGHGFRGFLLFQLRRYEDAIESFERALALQPDDCYAHCKISRAYALRSLRAGAVNPLKRRWRKEALGHLDLARGVATPDERRIGWLKQWLKRKGLL